MSGEIYLIRTAAEKIVPALCLKQEKDIYSFAQLRSSSKKEEIRTPLKKDMKVSSNKNIKSKLREAGQKRKEKIIVRR